MDESKYIAVRNKIFCDLLPHQSDNISEKILYVLHDIYFFPYIILVQFEGYIAYNISLFYSIIIYFCPCFCPSW